jgi:hypothetical protein
MMVGALTTGGAPNVKSWAVYALAAIGSIAAAGWLLALAFAGPRDAAAIRLSAIVAIVVQLVAFAVTKANAQRHLIAAWGVGSLLRFMTLLVYALLAVKVLGLPSLAALVSLATFLFLSTLIEPLFLRR